MSSSSLKVVPSQRIQEEIWKGKIPIQFIMNPSDIAMNLHVESHYLLVSRFSYLYEISQETIQYFQNKALELTSTIWFESNGNELRFHLPIGILYDQYQFFQKKQQQQVVSSSSSPLRHPIDITEYEPWKIIIHFQKGTKPSINPISFQDTQRMYFHSMKQAIHQLKGSCSNFNLLTIEHQAQLWQAVNYGLFPQFLQMIRIISPSNNDLPAVPSSSLSANATTIETPIQPPKEQRQEEYQPEQELTKQLPIRLLINDGSFRQRLVKPYQPNDSDSSGIEKERNLQQILQEDFQILSLEKYHIVIHGIIIDKPWQIPMKEFYFIMRYGDFYLYVLLFER